MPSSNKSPRCSGCSSLLLKVKGQKKKINTQDEAAMFSAQLKRRIVVSDILCQKCRVRPYKKAKLDTVNVEEEIEDLKPLANDPPIYFEERKKEPESERVEVPIPRTISTHKYCCLCCESQNLTVIPEEARIQAYIKRKIHIPVGNRCCQNHLIKNRFYEADMCLLKIYSSFSSISPSELVKMMENLAVRADSSLYDKVGDYSLSEKQLLIFTGLNWENLLVLRDMLTSMRNRDTRTITQALVVFLFKLRTGNSNKLIASIFQLENEQVVSEYSASVIKSFEKDVLPFHFGLACADRKSLIENHTTEIAKSLFDSRGNLMLICDGTYARHQKSSNNAFQRKTYSGQKKVPLCKPFTICTTDGYIVDVLGPYPANFNDAEILRSVIKENSDLCKLLKKDDFLILDRGFRDVKPELELKGFKVLMPALKGKRKQLTTIESNDSRYVTKIRWAVEAVHGILKQKNKMLDHKLDNKMLLKVGTYFRIAGCINNFFGRRLLSDADMLDDILQRLKSRRHVLNSIADEADEKGWWRKKIIFQEITSLDLLDFPEMTENDLKILFTGTYQLSQAVSYLAEMVDKDGKVNLQFLKDKSNVLKVQVQSRHISRKMYRCFLEYNPNSIGVSGLLRYACDCANGRRTVGCCSHIAATVYFLSHARYLSKIYQPSVILNKMFCEENTIPVIEEDSDED